MRRRLALVFVPVALALALGVFLLLGARQPLRRIEPAVRAEPVAQKGRLAPHAPARAPVEQALVDGFDLAQRAEKRPAARPALGVNIEGASGRVLLRRGRLGVRLERRRRSRFGLCPGCRG